MVLSTSCCPRLVSMTLSTRMERCWVEENVALPVKESPTMLFAIMVKSIQCIHEVIKYRDHDFHFYGASSCGKTTLLQVGQSVSGVASDPSAGPWRRLMKWTEHLLGSKACFNNELALAFVWMNWAHCLVTIRWFAYSVTGGQSSTWQFEGHR